jgi:hypothetical protein
MISAVRRIDQASALAHLDPTNTEVVSLRVAAVSNVKCVAFTDGRRQLCPVKFQLRQTLIIPSPAVSIVHLPSAAPSGQAAINRMIVALGFLRATTIRLPPDVRSP